MKSKSQDPGLQPERTLLSWQRTLILVGLVGLLYLRGPLVPGSSVVPEAPPLIRVGVMALSLLLCAALGVHLWSRWRRTAHGTKERGRSGAPLSVARPWAMAVLSGGVLVLTVAVVVTVLIP